MIENRRPDPIHVRDLLLLAGADTTSRGTVDPTLLAGLEIADVLAIGAQLIQGQLQALTAGARSIEARHTIAIEVFESALVLVDDSRAVSAMGTIIGALSDGERSMAMAIARCLAAFGADELAEAAIALLATTLTRLAVSVGAPIADVVQWCAGDGDAGVIASPERHIRPMFCTRDAAEAAVSVAAPPR